jgi:hypothetical protein
MDDDRFDVLSKSVGEETSRRGMLKAAAGGVLGLLGLGALSDGVWAGKGFDGQKCKKNKNCGTGLECRGAKKKKNGKDKKGKCRYKNGCGDKGDLCKNNDDCCGSRKCRNNNCRSNN